MKIIIDLSVLRHPFCGLGQIALNYKQHFCQPTQLQANGHELTLLVPHRYMSSDSGSAIFHPARKIYRSFPALAPSYDVWHSIHQFSNHRPGSKATRRILTIHDLNFLYEKTPEKQLKYKARLQSEVDSAAVVCFISHFALDEARRNLNLDGKRTQIIYNGVEDLTLGSQKCPEGLNPDVPFFLSLGVVKAKKNIHTLLPLMSHFPHHQLIIAGSDTDPYALQLKKQLGEHPNVHIIGTVDDEQRRWLYAHCSALLFPSLAEGFGLPVIEAMQWGKPVCCSQCTSLPEIGSTHAFYFPDFSHQGMAATVQQALQSFSKEKAAQEKSYAAMFSYERHFANYENLYLELLAL